MTEHMTVPAACVVVGDEIYAAGMWLKVTERLLSTPMPGKITFHVTHEGTLRNPIFCGATAKVSVKRA